MAANNTMNRKQSVDNNNNSNNNNENNNNTTIKEKKDKDPLNFFYKPHTILALVIAGIITIYFAFTKEQTQRDSVKTGLFAACSAFLLFSMLQMRDGLFIRPHPAFWRVIMGAGVLYLCALVFLLFQSADDARMIMKHIDPRLGVPLPERSYAENCDLYTPNDPDSYFKNLKNTVQDEFIWAHFFGWWGKTLLLRDSALCWVLSISFEILELTFEHLLPNFKECWWDHIILDILVCNALGIFMGLLTIRYLNMKEYNWGGVEAKTQPKKSIAMRLFTQFTPATFEEYHWEIFSEWKRFLAVIGLVFLISVIELNAFFLKTLLWIPPPNPINIYRLLLWCLIGTPGLREYYQFATDSKTKKLGTMAWICIAGVFVEVLICVKYGGAMFWAIPTPPEVKYPWIIGTSIFTVTSIIYFAFYKKRNPSSKKNNQKLKSKVK